MYVLRSALRASTRRPPARFIRGRRYPSPIRFRPFHTHHALAQASNPPQNPDSTPIGENDAGKTDREKAAAGDPADATVATDDPEILAQKLQRSRETSRRYSAALRRQQRAKKSQGLPPVHIPDWFLKGRVIRPEDLPEEVRKQARSAAFAISVSHAESGEEAACAIPASREEDGARELSRLVRGLWGKRLDDHELRKVEKYRDERKASSQSGVEAKQKSNSGRKDGTKIERRHKERGTERTPRARMPPLVLAEIKATIAASLSTLAPTGGDSFPSAKTNLLLHAPAADQEKMVDTCVHGIAAELGSEIVVLNAQDLAQLAGDYLGEGPEPSPRSIRSLGYETYRLSAELDESVENYLEATGEEPEFPQPPPMHPDESDPMNNIRGIGNFVFDLRPVMETLKQRLRSPQVPGGGAFELATNAMNNDVGRSQSQSELHLEDLKITALLEALLDASDLKQTRGMKGVNEAASPLIQKDRTTDISKAPAFFDYSVDSDGQGLELNSALPANVGSGIELNVNFGVSPPNLRPHVKSKIIYVKDYKEMYATHYGGRIIQKLEEVVRKRRISGESIMIVGSTCSRELTPELTSRGVRDLQGSGETTFSRTIVVGTESRSSQTPLHELFAAMQHDVGTADALPAEKSKFQRINLSHIREMLRYLDPAAATGITNMDQRSRTSRPWLSIFPDSYLKRVLTYDEVHRIALTALGLYNTDPARSASAQQGKPGQVNWAHVALAIGLLRASDTIKYAAFDRMAKIASTQKRSQIVIEENERRPEDRILDEQSLQRQRHLQTIAAAATKHEKRLLPGIADPHQIKTTFDQVHVSQDTVDSIRTITSLSLLRPDAFNYGILATEKISGALLYGPPGTGKTLLAKAVAKESGSTVLEVSGSQIMDKYVGEGEKNVAAVFSLARKLSPCIVFLDEADAIFASRDSMSERTSHRDILNQFLKEWDGLNNLSVFVMVATNRPFDLDDAVIRRLPRRLLVDLPTQADRKEILSIHLRGEQLDPSVDLEDIAKRTPFYSGSDLKNIAISAALACVKEENEQAAIAAARATLETDSDPQSDPSSAPSNGETTPEAASPTPTPPSTNKPQVPHLVRGQIYDFPDRRTLHARHFDQALQEISASISEDMSSLNAIKKFDEQYGDRKGKKRRKDFGFGALAERNESEARVRK